MREFEAKHGAFSKDRRNREGVKNLVGALEELFKEKLRLCATEVQT